MAQQAKTPKQPVNNKPSCYRKAPYAMKALEDALRKNEQELEYWQKHVGKSIAQVEGNISPCEDRIAQIKEVISILEQVNI
jgi:hypothetical protein